MLLMVTWDEITAYLMAREQHLTSFLYKVWPAKRAPRVVDRRRPLWR